MANVQAANVNWTGASSTAWSNAGNWTGGTGIPVAADTVIFGAAGSSTTQGTVTNVVDTDFTIAALRFENQSDNATPQFHTTQIDPTKTLLDNGGNTLLHVGSLNNAATAFSVYETITGSGTFTLNNTGGTVQIRQGSVAGSFTGRATLDMSGLANFNANVSNFRIGFGEGSTTNFNRATGTAILAANNTITAANLTVASGSASTGGTSQLTLGQNNTFNVGLFEVGTRKSTGMVNFNSAVSGGNLVIRAQNGTGRANLTIGLAQASEVTTSNGVGTIDLTGATGTRGTGSIDALLGNLQLGRANSNNNAQNQGRGTGRLSYESGTIDVNNVTLGESGSAATTSGVGSGTLEVLGTANLVVNNDVTLAKQISTPAAASLAAVGSLSVSGTGAGSTARIAGSIIDGGGTSNVTVATGSLSATKIGTVAAPVDNLTVNNGTLTLSLDAANPSAAVTTLTANGANTIGANVTGPVIPGTYTLMQYGSVAGAGASTFTASKFPARMVATLDTTPLNSINLVVSSFDSPKWAGHVGGVPNNVWDVNGASPNNWQLISAATPTNYQENLATYSTTDSVLFDDSAMTTNVNVAATVAPASMTFNNATNYTFGGTGAIVGGGPVTKNNTGSVLISNAGANTLGAVAINAGNVTVANAGGTTTGGITVASGASLTVGDNATAGAGNLSAGTIASAGTVNFNRPDASTNATAISGAGTVNYSGSGATTVTGASTYTGVTNITAGVVKPTASNSFGSIASGSGVVNVSAGAAIDVASGTTANGIDYGTNKVFNVVGAGPTGDGVIVHSGVLGTNNQQNAFEKINLTGNATFGGTGRFDTRGTSGTPAVLDLAGNTLTKAGAGQFSVVATNVTDGDIHVTAGTMSLETTSNVAGSGTITMDGGTTLQFFRPTNTISRNMVWNGTTATDASQTNTVNITSPIVMGASNTIQINSSTGFTYSGNITESAAAGITKTGGGTLDLTGANNYSGTTTVSAGTLRVSPAGAAPSSPVVVDAGEYNMSSAAGAGAFKSASITVNNAALAQMTANGTSTLVTGSVSVAPTAKLDTTDNDIVVNSMAFSEVQNLVLTGFGNNPGGITSSTSDGSQILALFDNTLVGAPDWNGIPIGANATVGKYTYFGDANIDGQVTGDDYGVVDANLNTTPAVGLGWLSGDMNLDGSVTGDDYGVIDANLGLGNGNPLSASSLGSMPAGSLSAVPEPASIGLLAATGLLLGRRRRSSK